MSSSAMPKRRLQVAQQLQDLRLDGDVERGGGLVGDQQIGLVGERHGDHHALALAARELVRIGVEPLLGLRQPDQAQQLQHPRARGRAASGALCTSSTSSTCRSMVCSGLSEVIGSWKTMAMRLPRTSRSVALAARRASRCPGRGCCPPGAAPAGRAAAAGSRARSPTCRSRSRRPAPPSPRARSSNETPRTRRAPGRRGTVERRPRPGSRAPRAAGVGSAVTERPCADRRRRAPPRR